MPLPREQSIWPPADFAPAFDRYAFDEAIWLNDLDRLSAIVGGGNTGQTKTVGRAIDATVYSGIERRGGILNLARRWNWRGGNRNNGTTSLPAPIGANVASLSQALLTSESPMMRIVDSEGRVTKGAAQERLSLIGNSDDARAVWNEGAELAAAISGCIIRLNWDNQAADAPWFDVIGADIVIPEFIGSRLVAANLWTEYAASGNRMFRHFERHESGKIIHALYLGTAQSVGKIVRLDRAGVGLEYLYGIPGAFRTGEIVELPTGVKGLTVGWWKNLPTRTLRKGGALKNLGRSDFEGIEPMIDAYSEAWGSMMRDVRLGKARIIVPQSMLKSLGVGQGAGFDADTEVYDGLSYLNPEGSTDQIKPVEMHIRWAEHMGVLRGIRQEILDGAGYSIASYGQDGAQGGGTTATEVVDRTTKSERTRDQKALYMKRALQPLLRTALEVDKIQYPGKGGGQYDDLRIDFPDVSQVDPEKQARQFLDLRSANAISIEQTVRERRPNWDDDEIDAEVARIQTELDARTSVDGAVERERIELDDPADPGQEDEEGSDGGRADRAQQNPEGQAK